MVLAGVEILIRFPVLILRTRPWICDRCSRYRDLSRDGRCRECGAMLRRVWP